MDADKSDRTPTHDPRADHAARRAGGVGGACRREVAAAPLCPAALLEGRRPRLWRAGPPLRGDLNLVQRLNSPSWTPPMKASHSAWVKVRVGPSGFLLSRTWTWPVA